MPLPRVCLACADAMPEEHEVEALIAEALP